MKGIQRRLDQQLNSLESYRVYDYSDLNLDSSDPSIRSALSRRKDKIRKLGKGRFYISENKSSSKQQKLYRVAHDKISMKRGSVAVKSLRLSRNLFWSNPDGYVPVGNLIAAVIEKGSSDDIDSIRYRYGDNKVIEVLLKHFNLNEPKYKRVSLVLGV